MIKVGIINQLQCTNTIKYKTKILGIFIFLDLVRLVKTNYHKPAEFNRCLYRT